MRRHSRDPSQTAAQNDRGDTVKVLAIPDTDLEECVKAAQRQRVVITRKGKPVALMIGVKGKDLEQVELGSSDKFWSLVGKWRQQKAMSRTELERQLGND